MAVSLTEWRFARPADALPPSSLASRPSLLLFAQPTYLPQPGSARDHSPHQKHLRHYISLRPRLGWRNRRVGEVTSPQAILGRAAHGSTGSLFAPLPSRTRWKEREGESAPPREHRKIAFFSPPRTGIRSVNISSPLNRTSKLFRIAIRYRSPWEIAITYIIIILISLLLHGLRQRYVSDGDWFVLLLKHLKYYFYIHVYVCVYMCVCMCDWKILLLIHCQSFHVY